MQCLYCELSLKAYISAFKGKKGSHTLHAETVLGVGIWLICWCPTSECLVHINSIPDFSFLLPQTPGGSSDGQATGSCHRLEKLASVLNFHFQPWAIQGPCRPLSKVPADETYTSRSLFFCPKEKKKTFKIFQLCFLRQFSASIGFQL